MSVNKMSKVKMPASQIAFGEMPVSQTSFGQMSFRQMFVVKCLSLLKFFLA
jgi:hypothetical protein